MAKKKESAVEVLAEAAAAVDAAVEANRGDYDALVSAVADGMMADTVVAPEDRAVAEPPQAAEWVFRGKPFTQLMLHPGLGYPGEWAIRFAEDGRYRTRLVQEANALRAYQAQGGPVREEV